MNLLVAASALHVRYLRSSKLHNLLCVRWDQMAGIDTTRALQSMRAFQSVGQNIYLLSRLISGAVRLFAPCGTSSLRLIRQRVRDISRSSDTAWLILACARPLRPLIVTMATLFRLRIALASMHIFCSMPRNKICCKRKGLSSAHLVVLQKLCAILRIHESFNLREVALCAWRSGRAA